MPQTRSFDDHPLLAIWETTQACDLACKHCRACAKPERHPEELDTREGKQLLDALARGRVPLVVLTGGDPAKREDLVELVAHGHALGLHMGLTPSATPLMTDALLARLAEAGLGRLAISIDAPDAPEHDAFRGVNGSFQQSLRILSEAKRLGITTQVNTSVHAQSIDALSSMLPLIREVGCLLWSVFFVVPTGRAGLSMLPTAERVERCLEWLVEVAESESVGVKTTAAPHYRRVLLARKAARRHAVRGLETLRINEGRGFMFISHRGDYYPSGFLPVPCGNVRIQDPVTAYRTHPTFRALRDPAALTGKCGACEYKHVCGGSRARAYATTGSLLASDPLCSYVPPAFASSDVTVGRHHLRVTHG
ncbi:MAG TPA: radical SAM protein [Polyangiaceae bacterium]